MPTHLPNWLAHRATVLPDHPALLADGVVWSFTDLNELATRMARRLLAQGAQPGERVALLLRNSPALVGLLHNGTAQPMALVICGCGVLAVVCATYTARISNAP